MKEQYISNPLEVQRAIWGKTCGAGGLNKRVEQAKKGWIPQGLSFEEISGNGEKFSKVLGDFAPKVLVASNPGSMRTLVPEQIAVAGGWCALRTKDVAGLSSEGVIMNPATGRLDPVESVDQVSQWIRGSVAFDQIVESIGAVNAGEYVAISERRLWTSRVVSKLTTIFGRKLTADERNLVELAVESAEQTRFQMTGRYLEFVTGRPAESLRRVVDDDIWEGLKKSRNEMFGRVGLSLPKLQERYPREKESLPYGSLVWTMYSEPYFDMLRQEGYMRSQKVFVVEPSLHATAESPAESEMTAKLCRNKGVYHDPSGINPNTGFIAYLECVDEKGKNVRKEQYTGEVPNVTNWRNLFDGDGMLSFGKNNTLTVSENQIFLWGANFLPFGQTQKSLMTLVGLQDEFKREKERIHSDGKVFGEDMKDGRIAAQSRVDALRNEILIGVQDQNAIIAGSLKRFFGVLSNGLEI